MKRRSILICCGPLEQPESWQNWALAESLGQSGFRVHILTNNQRHDLVGPWKNCQVHTWPSMIPGKWADVCCCWKLLRRIRPAAVLANFAAVNIAVPLARAFGVPVRIVWYRTLSMQTTLDFTRLSWKQRCLDQLKKFIYRQASHVVAVSPAGMRDVQRQYGISARRCAVFHTCRPDPLERIDYHRVEKAAARRILYLGRLAPSKGVDVLLQAVHRLRSAEPTWHLEVDLIGAGPCEAELQTLAKQLQLEQIVHFHGYIPQPAVFRRMAEAHVQAVPIRTDPGPGVIPEGLGLGLPMVVTAAGGMIDLLAGSGAVLFVPPDDSIALANALHRVLSDSSLRQNMAREARQLFLEKFHLNHWVHGVTSFVIKAIREAGIS